MEKESSVLAFSTKGTGSNEEDRLRELVRGVEAELIHFDKSRKLRSFRNLLGQLGKSRGKLVVMEGTGIAGGMACLIGRFLYGHRYVVSSGDAVGPFVGAHYRVLALPFGIYERLLCRMCSGFIGWTPYLVGRALTYGAPRGITAAGWVIGSNVDDPLAAREKVRKKWGVADGCVVFGIAGSIVWNRRRQYCYGLELVRAIRQSDRADLAVVVIGEGSGLAKLRAEAGDDLGRRIFLPGSVPLDEVMENLCGLDIASLPQSTDSVGAFRYTTKISEYRSANLPIVTLRIPAAYDLNLGKCWRLPGDSPWDPVFINALAELMQSTSQPQLLQWKQENPASKDNTFCRELQVRRVAEFLRELQESLSLR